MEAITLKALDVKLASSWMELQDVPAIVVQDYSIVCSAYNDAEEWRMMQAKSGGKSSPTSFGA